MTYEDFQTKFHQIHSDSRIERQHEFTKLDRDFAKRKEKLRQKFNNKLWDDIRVHFKKMDFDSKVKFMRNYVQSGMLEQFLEPHELTAYRMLK